MVPQLEIGPRERLMTQFKASDILSLPEASNNFSKAEIEVG
jgi:hypothetical protein